MVANASILSFAELKVRMLPVEKVELKVFPPIEAYCMSASRPRTTAPYCQLWPSWIPAGQAVESFSSRC